ncbi:hypothetical protein [Pedobacter sp. SYSU D00535]|uniref:hypothetical protein n=1 Tax=Pedobacter sp. SYSU D00535 TaxID=2810308 RepID=UPI001A97A6E1|nr:hypothetical protein [Pedobacter sp. SYSU D00535]
MSKSNSKSVNVYLTLDQPSIDGYFNKHDPSPIYKRQLSHQFEQYILASVSSAKRYDPIFYKIKCTNEIDKQYAEPVMYAIRTHFNEKKAESLRQFTKFKRRNWGVLLVSLIIVIILNVVLPNMVDEKYLYSSGVRHLLDVFSWVIFFHPIDELIFNWNSHLKEILLLNKLATAELILIQNEKKSVISDNLRVVAA